jgi:hypothetical protein
MSDAPREIIAIKARQTGQLFNSFDPSPFHEKELDSAADAFVVGWLQDIGNKPFAIEVALPASAQGHPAVQDIGPAFRNHFALRAQAERRLLRQEFRRGLWALGIGLAFLAVCLGARELLADLTFTGQTLLLEGLLIIGWVAMWGPIEIFLYGWWPIAGRAQALERLARAEVSVIFAPE